MIENNQKKNIACTGKKKQNKQNSIFSIPREKRYCSHETNNIQRIKTLEKIF